MWTLLVRNWHDGRGWRFRKRIGNSGPATLYHYSPDGLLLAEVGPYNQVIAEYVYLEGVPLALASGGGLYYIHANHLGAPVAMTDAGRAVAWRADPFGRATVANPATALNLRFPGQYFDAETGLHYNYFRDYDSDTGRYRESDPIGLRGGVNNYAYAEGNPVNLTDPQGLWVERCSRELGDRDKPETKQRFYNLLRHDYLNVSGQIFSFQAGSNMAWSQGKVDDNEDRTKGCHMVCNDDKFDQYVLDAANEVGAPTYCVLAFQHTSPYLAGARNCQSWADDVLNRAKEKYLQNETCPKCFK